MDEDGYYKITGRLKDMIIRGGENVYPREIEEFLYTHPKISDVQVIGVPDERFGEEVMAWVMLRPGETADSEEEIREFCRGKIAHFKVPAVRQGYRGVSDDGDWEDPEVQACGRWRWRSWGFRSASQDRNRLAWTSSHADPARPSQGLNGSVEARPFHGLRSGLLLPQLEDGPSIALEGSGGL